jgi:hypothetical protein
MIRGNAHTEDGTSTISPKQATSATAPVVSGESEFGPKDYSGQNDFEPLDLPENHKDVRPSVPLGEAAGAVFA